MEQEIIEKTQEILKIRDEFNNVLLETRRVAQKLLYKRSQIEVALINDDIAKFKNKIIYHEDKKYNVEEAIPYYPLYRDVSDLNNLTTKIIVRLKDYDKSLIIQPCEVFNDIDY